jgi:transcriptional regulator with XRE-family HTH domain
MATKEDEIDMEALRLRGIARRVKALREAHGMTQEQLHQASGLSLPTIQRIEAGQKVSSASLADLAAAFGEKVDYFDKVTALDGIDIDVNSEEWQVELKKHGLRPVSVAELASPMAVEAVLGVDLMCIQKLIVGDPELREEVLDLLAEFEQSVADWQLMGSDLEPSHRRDAVKDLWHQMERLRPFGYMFAFGLDKARPFGSRNDPTTKPIRFDIGFLLVVRHEKLPRFHWYAPADVTLA